MPSRLEKMSLYSELQIQVGIGVQNVVLEDVAGLDGLHQTTVVGVDDCGGQTQIGRAHV